MKVNFEFRSLWVARFSCDLRSEAVALLYHSVLHWSHCVNRPRVSNTLNNSAREFVRDCSLFASARARRRKASDVSAARDLLPDHASGGLMSWRR
jgi:hypothetical protein